MSSTHLATIAAAACWSRSASDSCSGCLQIGVLCDCAAMMFPYKCGSCCPKLWIIHSLHFDLFRLGGGRRFTALQPLIAIFKKVCEQTPRLVGIIGPAARAHGTRDHVDRGKQPKLEGSRVERLRLVLLP